MSTNKCAVVSSQYSQVDLHGHIDYIVTSLYPTEAWWWSRVLLYTIRGLACNLATMLMANDFYDN